MLLPLPQNALKEVHGYLLSVFSKVECEKDYTFSSKPPGMIDSSHLQGCMQKFFQGGANLGYGQKRGAEAYVRWYTLHLLGGARMTQGGANAPPHPPLNAALIWEGPEVKDHTPLHPSPLPQVSPCVLCPLNVEIPCSRWSCVAQCSLRKRFFVTSWTCCWEKQGVGLTRTPHVSCCFCLYSPTTLCALRRRLW